MRQKRRQACIRSLVKEVRSLYAVVHAKPTQGLFNQNCYNNAVEFALNDHLSSTKVVECIYIDSGFPVLHYLNKRNDVYLETTLGYQAREIEYHIIKEIPPVDYVRVQGEFDRSLSYWTNRHTNWLDRNVLRLTRIL